MQQEWQYFNSKIIENFIENKNNSAVFNLQLQPSTSNTEFKKIFKLLLFKMVFIR